MPDPLVLLSNKTTRDCIPLKGGYLLFLWLDKNRIDNRGKEW